MTTNSQIYFTDLEKDKNAKIGIAALVVAVGVATLVGSVASNKIGGQTGDILGATQLLAEISSYGTDFLKLFS